ncbi:MAG: RsmB/NOP family class I SAM-dependent RNA methyltransferase [Hellea sp.]|nr:RsmB/NOP family class I SAM-dependent RNA methyltransferase [Hellea sp.]
MKFAGRIQASIEVLEDILSKRTPATMALRDWGKSNRYAGSKDRSFVGNIVHDALRQKSSIGYRMDDDSARALTLGTLAFNWDYTAKKIQEHFDGDKFAPSPLSDKEKRMIGGAIDLSDAPLWVQGDVPEWLWPAFENNFGEEALAEAQALTKRPPLDVRINLLRADIKKAGNVLTGFGATPCDLSTVGYRMRADTLEGRLPNIQIEEIFQTGGIEIQDEGSQLVSALVNAQPGDKILDYCAGGGGKSLAMAAEMANDGMIHAFDIDKRRLSPLYQRAMRAGADIIDVRNPPVESLKDLKGTIDKLLIDAPCTGVGTWRRKPDAKWRVSEEALERRNNEQSKILATAHQYLRPGGLLFYVTCSMLAEENEAQVYQFLENHKSFNLLSAGEVWEEKFGTDGPKPWSEDGLTVTLTPESTNTDGFFFAVMEKQKG